MVARWGSVRNRCFLSRKGFASLASDDWHQIFLISFHYFVFFLLPNPSFSIVYFRRYHHSPRYVTPDIINMSFIPSHNFVYFFPSALQSSFFFFLNSSSEFSSAFLASTVRLSLHLCVLRKPRECFNSKIMQTNACTEPLTKLGREIDTVHRRARVITLTKIFCNVANNLCHFKTKNSLSKRVIIDRRGTLPWAIFRSRIFSNYFAQKFEKIKITVWKSDNLTMYENFCLDLYWYYYT